MKTDMKTYKILILFLALISSSAMSPGQQQKADMPTPQFYKNIEISAFEYQKFLDHSALRLGDYKMHFKRYSYEYQIPWELVAAVAYQESKWDENATSYTGVKGLMQLTAKTAEFIGIQDREDPIQSIRGGTYYLKYLFDKTPERLNTTQRWILALVAYNIGWGHLQDARLLARLTGKNPYKWSDLKTVLPKLQNSIYYKQLPLGYARGHEAVDFVERVMNYYNLISADPEMRISKSN